MKADKIFWGLIFVFIGGVFLLENFGYIDFSWRYVWRFWPLLLIITGINIIFSNSRSPYGAIAIAVITVISLGFLTIKGLQKPVEKTSWKWSFSDDDKDENWDSNDEKASDSYTEDFDARYKKATLNIKGGAGTFVIDDTTGKLFDADIKKNSANFYLRKNDLDTAVVLDFNSKNDKNQYSFGKNFNKAHIKLNTNPVWDVNLKIGAGKTDFDFSEFRVRDIEVKGGAAEFNITLGSLYPKVVLNAETGVAEINIKVPESSGCQITTKVGLSSKDFNGFVKVNDNLYQTTNYKTSTNKIEISLKGGLSDFNVVRY